MPKTKIEWADYTWNPWYGCTKVSPACDNCFAASWGRRSGLMLDWGAPRERTARAVLRAPLLWNMHTLRHHPRVFTLSLGDFFDNQVPPQWRIAAWNLIRDCQRLDWLILTKRPQNIPHMLPPDWDDGWPHVWLGVSVENMTEARRRIPLLVNIPATVRWLSCEPLLELLDLRPWFDQLHWVIAGGETGGGSDRTALEEVWFRQLRDDCNAADIAFFMKQMTNRHAIPGDLRIRQYPPRSTRCKKSIGLAAT